jgi:hypothetical protein
VPAPNRFHPRVDVLEDRVTPATFLVTNTGDNNGTNPAAGAGTGTLRQAIVDANADTNSGLDTIAFNIPGTGVQTISPKAGLPHITHQVLIDGTTQPGFAGKPVIQIEGSSAGVSSGLRLDPGSDGSIIRDLIINRFGSSTTAVPAIEINQSTGNQILGNYLGTDYTGSLALGNNIGVLILGDLNQVGGVTAAARNVISGNGSDGIVIGSAIGSGFPPAVDNVVEGNYIGTDASGTQPLDNGENGILVLSQTSIIRIGGTAPGAGNLIAFNGGIGVDAVPATGTSILGNTIFANEELGIDVNGDGVTPNTPNGAQNFPVLLSAVTNGGATTVQGTLNSTPSTTFRLEFFANPAPDPSGFGQGQTFLGATSVTTDGSGNATFTVTLAAVPAGQFPTATSTGPAGTSEFAQDIPVPPTPTVSSPSGPSPTATPSQGPVLTVYFVQPPAKGQIAVSGFVLDPAGQLRGQLLIVVIDWGDGTKTSTGLFVSDTGFDSFLPLRHKKPKGHKPVTASIGFVDLLTPVILST